MRGRPAARMAGSAGTASVHLSVQPDLHSSPLLLRRGRWHPLLCEVASSRSSMAEIATGTEGLTPPGLTPPGPGPRARRTQSREASNTKDQGSGKTKSRNQPTTSLRRARDPRPGTARPRPATRSPPAVPPRLPPAVQQRQRRRRARPRPGRTPRGRCSPARATCSRLSDGACPPSGPCAHPAVPRRLPPTVQRGQRRWRPRPRPGCTCRERCGPACATGSFFPVPPAPEMLLVLRGPVQKLVAGPAEHRLRQVRLGLCLLGVAAGPHDD